jgi:hypothetical protein
MITFFNNPSKPVYNDTLHRIEYILEQFKRIREEPYDFLSPFFFLRI